MICETVLPNARFAARAPLTLTRGAQSSDAESQGLAECHHRQGCINIHHSRPHRSGTRDLCGNLSGDFRQNVDAWARFIECAAFAC